MDRLELADILAIWPIAKSFALHSSVGDLIALSRTNSALRSSLHGCLPLDGLGEFARDSRGQRILVPEIGKHQTSDWAYLKSIAPLLCSNSTHIRGQITKHCVYCSMPICDACIVRDAFKHRNENTFKNRLRHYCPDCWSEGRPCRNFRYPAVKVDTDGNLLETPSYVRPDEDEYADLRTRCDCNFRNDSWLCIECKGKQNYSSATTLRPSWDSPLVMKVKCYGLDCENAISLYSPEKDRRRVCLWCEKPARRQFSSEDRMVWNMKTIEARRRNAESRRRDLEEYNQQRFKAMRMSRREMRGSCGPDDDKPVFVRHLDTLNYRNYMSEDDVPTPEAVWKSKNGYWQYSRGFLLGMQKLCKRVRPTQIGADELLRVTREDSSEHARPNREWYVDLFRPHRITQIPVSSQIVRNRVYLNELKVRILDLHLAEDKTAHDVLRILRGEYELSIELEQVRYYIQKWKHDIELSARLDAQYGNISNNDGGDSGRKDGSNDQNKKKEFSEETSAPKALSSSSSSSPSLKTLAEDPPDGTGVGVSRSFHSAVTTSISTTAKTTTTTFHTHQPFLTDEDPSSSTTVILTHSSPLEQVDSTTTTLADNDGGSSIINSPMHSTNTVGVSTLTLSQSRSVDEGDDDEEEEERPPPYA